MRAKTKCPPLPLTKAELKYLHDHAVNLLGGSGYFYRGVGARLQLASIRDKAHEILWPESSTPSDSTETTMPNVKREALATLFRENLPQHGNLNGSNDEIDQSDRRVVVTPQMIEAGLEVLDRLVGSDGRVSEILGSDVASVYTTMARISFFSLPRSVS